MVVDLLVLGGEGFAAAELFQDVVNAGEGEAGMRYLLALAVRVQTLAEFADALLECSLFERGEGKLLETGTLDVNRAIFETRTDSKRPSDMERLGKDAEDECVIRGDRNQLVIGEDAMIEESEETVFAGFHGGDVARDSCQCRTKIFARFAMNPPIFTVAVAIVMIPLRFHVNEEMLIKRWPSSHCFFRPKTVEIYDFHSTGFVREIAPIPVAKDMIFDSRYRS